MNRREFAKVSSIGLLALTTLGSLFTVGCTVWDEIQQWVPVGVAAFESVVALVAPLAAPGIDAIVELVKAGFASLAAAVNQYINAPAADKATLLQKVQLIFEDLSQNLQNFLDAIKISGSNPIVTVVLGLVNIILSTIMAFVNRVSPATALSRSLTMAGRSVSVTPVLRNKNKFRSDFNAVLASAGHPELEIH